MESLTFTKTSYEKPKDGQYVWLIKDGKGHPVPASFHKHLRRDYYSLLNGCEVSGDRHAWAPMTPPENQNMSG